MTAPVGGVVVGHEPDCGKRFWLADASRYVTWAGSTFSAPVRLLHPVPGDAPILFVDAWTRDPVALLMDGSTWRCHAASPRQRWHTERSLFAADGNALAPAARTLMLANVERRDRCFWHLWAVTNTRQIIVANEHLRPVTLGTPVPGTAAILAVRLVGPGAEVLCADGTLVAWGRSGWVNASRFPEPLVLGGCERRDGPTRRWWGLTASRQVLVADRELDAAVRIGSVPGTEPVLAVRLPGVPSFEALLADGTIT